VSISVNDIRAALEARLQAMVGYLGDANTQFENVPLNPVGGTAYQVVNLLLADPVNPEISSYVQQPGFYQVTLRYPSGPSNAGPGGAIAQAQKIRDWFSWGLSLVKNSTTVQINRTPTIGPGSLDGDRYSVPVKIRFNAY
jgi:hypothetical protein